MAILSGPRILEEIRDKRILIEPFDEALVNPASVDLRLGNRCAIYIAPQVVRTLDVKEEIAVMMSDADSFFLRPGELYLLHTVERVHTDCFVPVLDGKALALDTEIPTPSGWTTMGALKVGDLVFGSDGNPTRVIRTTDPMKNRKCFSVGFSDRTTIVADAEHEWLVEPVDAKPGIRTTAQMARRTKPGRGVFRVRAAPVNGIDLTLPIAPYTLGAWLGDGTSVNSNITIRHGDEVILAGIERDGYPVAKKLSPEKGASLYIIDRRTREVDDRTGRYTENGSFHSVLKGIGLLGNKHIPEQYLRASYAQRWALMQGLMDTDGTVHRDDQASITLTNERLLRETEELIRSLGIVTYFDERPAKIDGRVVGTAYRLTFRALPEMFRTERRKAKVRNTPKWLEGARKPVRFVQVVTPVESVSVRCITVENSDGLFMASRAFILTHNSSIGRLGIQVHMTAGYGDPGFDGQYTLEVTTVYPVRVYAGMRFCQIRFHELAGEPKLYQGNYTGEHSRGPVPSRAWKQFEEKK